MNNNAFKDLVRGYGDKDNGSSSSKAIARKAVEEEFRKKKRKHSGDSSSDEDDNHQSSYKRINKKNQQEEKKKSDNDAFEAIQKDLSSRYRDRAKERREGNSTNSTDVKIAAAPLGAPNNLLIVPHNIKGLDLALARKERAELQSISGGGNRKSTTTTNAKATDNEYKESTSKIEPFCKTRDKMPTRDQAYQILQAFLSTGNGKGIDVNYDDDIPPIILSNGLVEYLSEILSWKTLDVSMWESEPDAGAAWNSLQHTKFSMAIDGNPSDPMRAWEIPRQYTLSRRDGSEGHVSSSALLPIVTMNEINAVFRNQNSIREEMMEKQTWNAGNFSTSTNLKKETPVMTDKSNDNDFSIDVDDDESDDDMFKGLDD